MNNEQNIKIFLVDDDALFLKNLQIEFAHQTEYQVKAFATGELCLAHLGEKPYMIILDFHLNGIDKQAMNGIETLDKIKAFNPNIPVVILSSQDKIEVAVRCMHHKALDYIVKSETAFLRIQKNIHAHIHYEKIEKELNWYMTRM
jgi:two-component system, OmpR family, response regulator